MTALAQLLSNVANFAITGLWLGVVAFGLLRWDGGRFRRGLRLGLAALLLLVPGAVVVAGALDTNAFGLPDFSERTLTLGVQALVLGWLAIGFAHDGLKVSVIARLHDDPLPIVLRGDRSRGGLALSAAVGGAAGAIGSLVLIGIGIQSSPAVDALDRFLPSLSEQSVLQVLAWTAPLALAFALREELLFRGVLQFGLTRALRKRLGDRAAFLVALLLASALFSVAHAANAVPIGPKLAQTALLGLLFGGLAERYGLGAAMLAHLSHNLVAIVVGGIISARVAG